MKYFSHSARCLPLEAVPLVWTQHTTIKKRFLFWFIASSSIQNGVKNYVIGVKSSVGCRLVFLPDKMCRRMFPVRLILIQMPQRRILQASMIGGFCNRSPRNKEGKFLKRLITKYVLLYHNNFLSIILRLTHKIVKITEFCGVIVKFVVARA